jgi:hypothetical protein
MTQAEVTAFMNGNAPKRLLAIVEPDPKSTNLISRKFPGVVIGNVADIYRKYAPAEEESDE